MSIKHAMAILVVGVAALSTVATAQLPVPVPIKSKPVDPEPVEIIRTDFDPRELAEELERMRSRPEAPGQQLFVSRCAICHDPIGQPGSGETLGPWLDAELVSSKGEEAVRASILNGTANMPGFRHQFDAAQVDQIIAYMKTVPAEVRRWVPTEDRINAALWETPSAPSMHLAGTTTAASGEPLHGVAVSARRVESNYTTTVYSDEQGEYVFPPLHEGAYKVWAQATGFETSRADATLSSRTHQTFTLRPIADVTPQLRGPEWLAALPEETFEDRRMKEIFRVQCSECHQAGVPLQNRFDERGWRAIISSMEKAGYNGLNASSNRPPVAMRYHKNELAEYLARMRGPGESPMELKPVLPRPTGDAARVVITEYDVPVADTGEFVLWNGEDWSEGTPSGAHGGRSGPHDVAIDQDGNVWIAPWASASQSLRTLIKLNPETGAVRSYNKVRTSPRDRVYTHGIYVDQTGIMWFNVSGILGRADPESDEITTFTPPAGMRVAGTQDVDAMGKVWMGSTEGVLRFDPGERTFQYFQNPAATGGTYGVTGDRLGNGWWGRWTRDVVGHADVETGKTYEIPMRPPGAVKPESFMTDADKEFYYNHGALRFMCCVPWMPGGQAPRRMGADKNGDVIWVSNWWGGNLAEIDIHTREVTYHPLPHKGMHPYSAVVDSDHNVYTNVSSDDSVAKFDPSTREWTVYPLPSRGTEVRHIAVDGRNGDVWVPYATTNRVARLQFRTEAELQAHRADAVPAPAE